MGWLLVCSALVSASTAVGRAAQPVDEVREFAAPALLILRQNCLRCHNGDEHLGGLNMSSRDGLLRGGDSGPAIDLEAPEQSLLLRRAREGSMPPINDGDALTDDQLERLRDWLASGAGWPAAVATYATPGEPTETSSCARTVNRLWQRRHGLRWRRWFVRPGSVPMCSAGSVAP